MDTMDLDRAQADPRSGMEVSKGDEPAAPDRDTPEAKPWLTIGQRMAAIRVEAHGIGKDDIEMQNADRTKKWKIKGHTVEAVLSEMRPLLDKYAVDLTPNLFERVYNGNRCDVIVDFTFEVLDPENAPGGWPSEKMAERTIRWAGADTDNAGKAFAKAGTNCLKEMLKKVFLITDRNDAKEEEESIEHETEDTAGKARLAKANEQNRQTLENWAKAYKMALEKATEAKDIQRLERENASQLSSDQLPEVTRTFFIELAVSRKKALEGV